jgi:phosphinothricin acetyltransferase
MVEVRIAGTYDAKGILDIYAPIVLTRDTTFETVVPTLNEIRHRIDHYLQKFPWLVCTINDVIAGYAYASSHRDREAYQWSCECTVYIHEQFRKCGIGNELYSVLFSILKRQGIKNVYAGITLPNQASKGLHEKHGFKHLCNYDNVGYKLGEWKTVGWWKLQLNEYDPKPSPPLKFSQINHLSLVSAFENAAFIIQARINE